MEKLNTNTKIPSSQLKGSSKNARRTSVQNSTSSSKISFEQLVSETSSGGENRVEILAADGSIDEDILVLLQDDIQMAGQRLLARPGIDAVMEYRQKVQRLLRSVHPYLHTKEQSTAYDRISNSVKERKFTLVHTVNQKLDRLLQLIVSSQSTQMELMNALDEIRGLIINILH